MRGVFIPNQKKLYLSHQGKTLLKQFIQDIEFLKKNSNFHLENFVFSAQTKFSVHNRDNLPLNRVNFNRQINKVLDQASILLKKNFKTHSFRATFITQLLNSEIPIHKVKAIMGHKRIEATAAYDRTILTSKEIKATLTKVNKARLKQFQILMRSKKRKNKIN